MHQAVLQYSDELLVFLDFDRYRNRVWDFTMTVIQSEIICCNYGQAHGPQSSAGLRQSS
jgi:hypothetical protein